MHATVPVLGGEWSDSRVSQFIADEVEQRSDCVFLLENMRVDLSVYCIPYNEFL